MKNLSRHKGPLHVVRRLPSSRNGNPRWSLHVAGFHCVTAPDSSLGYKVQNFDGRVVRAVIGTHYGRATLSSVELVPSPPSPCARLWSVTYDDVTEESAALGDYEDSGFLTERATFRDAVEAWKTERTGDTIEADSYPLSLSSPPRWITAAGDMDNESGVTRSVSLHIPHDVTPASRMRIARALGCYGAT